MRYEVKLRDAYFYVTAPNIEEAGSEAGWFLERHGIEATLDEITPDESEENDN
jgi:hypothetical protein